MKHKKKEKFAAALKFNAEEDAAPKIMAIGSGTLAEEIIRLAKICNTPIIEDPQISDYLKLLPLGREIPGNLHRAMAEVFALIYRLEKEME